MKFSQKNKNSLRPAAYEYTRLIGKMSNDETRTTKE